MSTKEADGDSGNDEQHECPWEGCDYTSTELGVKLHHKRTHGVSLAGDPAVCEWCGESFRARAGRAGEARFCSTGCKGEWMAENGRFATDNPLDKGGKVLLVCGQCGESFRVYPAREDSARFCSRECTNEWLIEYSVGENNPSWDGGAPKFVCEYCGETFERHETGALRFCSRECFAAWRSENKRGENNPNWNGGHVGCYGPNWKRQRRLARERDGDACRRCGLSNGQHIEEYGRALEVHHITPAATLSDPDEANRLLNLITLCRECHVLLEGLPVDQRE